MKIANSKYIDFDFNHSILTVLAFFWFCNRISVLKNQDSAKKCVFDIKSDFI